jgi:succinate-semialdehyde dehydrogenase/glutarate-semialdehyde dehydrogenase
MIDIISPNTGEKIGEWQPSSKKRIESVLQAVAAPTAALGKSEQRQAWLNRLADRLIENRSSLASVIRDEVGKTQSEADDEVDYAVTFLRYGASMTKTILGVQQSGEWRLREVSAGPALLITPYNDPLAGITRKIAAAIAAGCPAVVKPSPQAQLTAAALFELIDEDDIRDFVYLLNHTDQEVLQALVTSRVFRVLSFTGSTKVGVQLARLAAGSMTKLVLELGGNNPFFVLPGADIPTTVAAAVSRKIRSAGQACSAQNRIYVVTEHFDAFREQFLEALDAVSFGPSDQAVSMGPLRTRQARDRLTDLVRASESYGTVHRLGKFVQGSGGEPFCFAPTVLENDHALLQKEAFGPLVSLTRIHNREEAIARAVNEPQALACYFYGDISAQDLAEVRFGSVGINTTGIQGADVPTGGFGSAGIGREGGLWGLREYITTINERWV